MTHFSMKQEQILNPVLTVPAIPQLPLASPSPLSFYSDQWSKAEVF